MSLNIENNLNIDFEMNMCLTLHHTYSKHTKFGYSQILPMSSLCLKELPIFRDYHIKAQKTHSICWVDLVKTIMASSQYGKEAKKKFTKNC